jgi:glutaredoxin
MTIAACFNCGEIKFGGFTSCPKCKRAPETDDDLAISLELTDHYYSQTELEKFGAQIKAGIRFQIDDATREHLLSGIPPASLNKLKRIGAAHNRGQQVPLDLLEDDEDWFDDPKPDDQLPPAAPSPTSPPERILLVIPSSSPPPEEMITCRSEGSHPNVGRNSILLLSPSDPVELNARVQPLQPFLFGCIDAVEQYAASNAKAQSHDVQLAVAIAPRNRLFVWATCTATKPDRAELEKLRQRVEVLARPQFSQGVSAFLIRQMISGGESDTSRGFGPPFGQLLTIAPPGTLESQILWFVGEVS